MKRIFTILMVLNFFIASAIRAQTTLSKWTFENLELSTTDSKSPVVISGDFSANAGDLTNNSLFFAEHAVATSWKTPDGYSPSAKSVSCANWSIGDYYQFDFSTLNYQNIKIKFAVYGSATGPKEFKVQYFNNNNWEDLSNSITNYIYSITTSNSWSTRIIDLSTLNVNNKNIVKIRLVNTSTVSIKGEVIGTSGTNRIDDFEVTGDVINPMPVALAYFKAKFNLDKVNLEWQSLSENNNSKFIIEKSTDGKQFYPFKIIESQTYKEKALNYSCTDTDILGNIQYYNLYQEDLNRDRALLKTLAVSTVMPIPKTLVSVSTTKVKLIINGKSNEKLTIQIMDVLGRKVSRQSVVLSKGVNELELESLMNDTVYMVNLHSEDRAEYFKIKR